MKVNTVFKVNTTLRLDFSEEFQAETMDNNKFGFFVNQITWDGTDWVTYRGPGRSRTGTRLAVTRSDTWRAFKNVPEELQKALKQSRQEALDSFLRDESVRILGPIKDGA